MILNSRKSPFQGERGIKQDEESQGRGGGGGGRREWFLKKRNEGMRALYVRDMFSLIVR